jgi:hypothetical protein
MTKLFTTMFGILRLGLRKEKKEKKKSPRGGGLALVCKLSVLFSANDLMTVTANGVEDDR